MSQKSILYMAEIRISASEESSTHINTCCVDLAGSGNDGILMGLAAPFDCKVVKIVHGSNDSNSVYFESLEPVLIPNIATARYMSFRCAHMNDQEYNLLNMRESTSNPRIFRQGEMCYYEGTKNATAPHIHIEFGKGKYVANENTWKPAGYGSNITINTVDGAIQIQNACYLHDKVSMSISESDNTAKNKVFTYANSGGTISEEQFVQENRYVVPTSNCTMHLTSANCILRDKPGGTSIANIPQGSTVKIIEFLPYTLSGTNYRYYRTVAYVQNISIVGYMQYDPEAYAPRGTASILSVKVTVASKIRTEPNRSAQTVRIAAIGEIEDIAEFINVTAGNHNDGWIKLRSGNYMQYDTDCMYPFGLTTF